METGELKDVFKESAGYTASQIEDVIDNLATYRALIEASNTGAWEYFTDTNYINCNHIYFTLLGRNITDYNLEERSNLKEVWLDLLHPEDVASASAVFADYINNPAGTYESFFRMLHSDGNWVWIWSRGKYTTDSNGNHTHKIVGTHVDVTRHKQVEEEIQHERILLRTLIDNLPDTIYVKDDEGRKVIANRADVSAIGASSEADVIGKTDLELFKNQIGERGYRDDMEVLHYGKTILDKEEFFWDADGNEHWLLTSKVPVRDADGKIIRMLGIGHNITRRKKAEESLNRLNAELNQQSNELSEQAKELKLLNEQLIQQKEQELEKAIAQGKFEIASEVLHDIGNALVGFGSYLSRINRTLEKSNIDTIKNLSQFLVNQQAAIGNAIGADKAKALVAITEGVSKAQVANKDEISASVTELLNIVSHIQEILNIQRQFVRGHGGVHDRKPVNLLNIIDDCRAMLFASLDKKGVQLKVDVKPGNYVIKGDHTKLMQVMLNVLKNSIEAIQLDTDDKKIAVSLSIANDVIELQVKDNGQGFDADTGQRFFERGFTTKKSGTGLGLYNCRSIVESHTGSFEITSDGLGLGAVTNIRFMANSL